MAEDWDQSSAVELQDGEYGNDILFPEILADMLIKDVDMLCKSCSKIAVIIAFFNYR